MKMKTTISWIMLTTTFLAVSGAASAQTEPWQVEARAGVASPLDDLGNIELETGVSVSATLAFSLTDSLSVYGGWGWHLLGADEVAGTPDGAVEETGYVLGLALENPFGSTGFDYRLQGGATYEHIQIEDDDGNVVRDTGHGAGFEIGMALVMPLSEQFSIVPGVRYRYLDHGIHPGGRRSSDELSFITTEVGFAWDF